MKFLGVCLLLLLLTAESRSEDAVPADPLLDKMQSRIVALKGKWIADFEATVKARAMESPFIEPALRTQLQPTFEATEIEFEEKAGIWTATCTRVSGKIEKGWTLLYDASFTPYIAILGRDKSGIMTIKLDGDFLTIAPAINKATGTEIVFARSK